MADKIQVVNIRLPEKIVGWIDELVKEGIYSTRSEVVRDFMREYVRQNR